jgi:hypothetical protein
VHSRSRRDVHLAESNHTPFIPSILPRCSVASIMHTSQSKSRYASGEANEGSPSGEARHARTQSGWHRLASVYKHLAKYDNIDRKRKAPPTPTDDRCSSSSSPPKPPSNMMSNEVNR